MAEQVAEALERLQEHAGKPLGDDEDPLLVSVRSGARESMPGMLDTVLNLGLNDTSVEGLARATENERFAWDSYRRFVQMFGNVSHGIPGEQFEDAIKEVKDDRGVKDDTELDVDALKELTETLQGPLRVPAGPAGAAAPGDPRGVRLLDGRARGRLPAAEPHPRRLGHRGQRPADGVRQQGRHVGLRRRVQPRRGHRRARAERRLPGQRPGRGRRLRRAQHARHRRDGRQAARGARAADGDPAHARGATTRTCRTRSSRSRRGSCSCSRPATPSARRRRRCASRSTRSTRGCSRARRRSRRSTRASLDALLHPTFDPKADFEVLATRRQRLAGRGQGRGRLHRRRGGRGGARTGRDVILVRPFTEADDVAGFHAAKGILTSEGGKASHAALVARGMGRPGRGRRRRADDRPQGQGDPRRRHDGRRGRPDRDRRHQGLRHARGRPAGRGRDERVLRHACSSGPTRSAGSACAPTPTRPRTRKQGARARAPRASACAAPSTCSWPRTASPRCGR